MYNLGDEITTRNLYTLLTQTKLNDLSSPTEKICCSDRDNLPIYAFYELGVEIYTSDLYLGLER